VFRRSYASNRKKKFYEGWEPLQRSKERKSIMADKRLQGKNQKEPERTMSHQERSFRNQEKERKKKEQEQTGASSEDEQGPARKRVRTEPSYEDYSQHPVYKEPCEQYQQKLLQSQISEKHLDRLKVESYVVGGWSLKSLREAELIPKAL
jgi:hypothetical protein